MTDPRDTLAELWSVAMLAHEAIDPTRPTPLHLAAYGHSNADAIIRAAFDEASTCPAAGDCPGCDSEPPATCPYATPERARLRDALAAVLAAMPAAKIAHARDATECGAVCPDGPYAGVICTEPVGHDGDHESRVERRPGAWDFLEFWPRAPGSSR